MRQLLVFVDPAKKFNPTNEMLTKIQIDNSLELGWKPEDIVLATNFPWEYRGVKAYQVPDDCFYGKNNYYRSSKVPVINQLFKDGIINEMFWFRDNDAWQLEPITEEELEMGDNVIAITNHGWHSRWNAGSFFFTPGSKDIWLKCRETMDEMNYDEQFALEYLINNKLIDKFKFLNLTYNFGIYYHVYTWRKVQKPLKVAHFHPDKQRHVNLYTPLITDRFIKLLKRYGIQATS